MDVRVRARALPTAVTDIAVSTVANAPNPTATMRRPPEITISAMQEADDHGSPVTWATT